MSSFNPDSCTGAGARTSKEGSGMMPQKPRLAADKRKGNVRSLASGARETFRTRLGYVDRRYAADLARSIAQSTGA
jgi:hypothetical protein